MLFEFGTHRHPAREFRNDLSGHFALEHELDSLDRPVQHLHPHREPGHRPLPPDPRGTHRDQRRTLPLRPTQRQHAAAHLPERPGPEVPGGMADRQRRWLPGVDRGPLHRERPPIPHHLPLRRTGRLAERTERPDLDKPTSKRRTFLYDQAATCWRPISGTMTPGVARGVPLRGGHLLPEGPHPEGPRDRHHPCGALHHRTPMNTLRPSCSPCSCCPLQRMPS